MVISTKNSKQMNEIGENKLHCDKGFRGSRCMAFGQTEKTGSFNGWFVEFQQNCR